MATRESLRIGELSERTGIPRHTIRFYERTGVLPAPARTPSGYRAYRPEAVERLEFIRKGQALGLKLADIAEVLDISEGGREPCDHVRELVEERLRDAESRLRELRELRRTLRDTLRRLDEAEGANDACRCAVIEQTPLDGTTREGPLAPPS